MKIIKGDLEIITNSMEETQEALELIAALKGIELRMDKGPQEETESETPEIPAEIKEIIFQMMNHSIRRPQEQPEAQEQPADQPRPAPATRIARPTPFKKGGK